MKVTRYDTNQQNIIGAQFYAQDAEDREVLQLMKKCAQTKDITLRLNTLKIVKDACTTEEMDFRFELESAKYDFKLTSDNERERMILGLMRGHTMMNGKVNLSLDNSSAQYGPNKNSDYVRFTFQRQTKQPFVDFLNIVQEYRMLG
jgi:hypothetical protein